jgi:hypothetical protein
MGAQISGRARGLEPRLRPARGATGRANRSAVALGWNSDGVGDRTDGTGDGISDAPDDEVGRSVDRISDDAVSGCGRVVDQNLDTMKE